MTTTFYVASPWSNKKAAGELAVCLVSSLRWRWANNWDWTVHEPWDHNKHTDDVACAIAARDISGAVAADVFVLLLDKKHEGSGRGSYAEFGARVGTNQEAYVILNGESGHPFWKHPCAIVHDTTASFRNAMGAWRAP